LWTNALHALPLSHSCGYKHCRRTDQKQLNVILQFGDGYPGEPVVTQLTSKTLGEKLLAGLVKMCDEEAKARSGQKQVPGGRD